MSGTIYGDIYAISVIDIIKSNRDGIYIGESV